MVHRNGNAIYQNLKYMERINPEYVLILSGDHIYKMDYEAMLDFHKQKNADVTIAAIPVPMEEASRFGVVLTDEISRSQSLRKSRSIREAIWHLWVSTYLVGRSYGIL